MGWDGMLTTLVEFERLLSRASNARLRLQQAAEQKPGSEGARGRNQCDGLTGPHGNRRPGNGRARGLTHSRQNNERWLWERPGKNWAEM